MSKEPQKSNFELAQEEANKIDLQIIDTLQKGYNFRVEAGAGSGKTYSLNKVVEWIQVNKWKQYRKYKNKNRNHRQRQYIHPPKRESKPIIQVGHSYKSADDSRCNQGRNRKAHPMHKR